MTFSRAFQQGPLKLIWLIVMCLTAQGWTIETAPAWATRRDALREAKECSRQLYRSKNRMRFRDQWRRCIDKYEDYYQKYPKGRQADEALYAIARRYEGLYGYSIRTSDLDEAIRRYKRVLQEFPTSRFADDSQYRLGEIYLKHKKDADQAYVEFFKVVIDFPEGDMKPRAQRRLAELEAKEGKRKVTVGLPPLPKVPAVSPDLARVTDIRHWSAPDYTRVVIDVDEQISFRSHLLKADPALKTPPRLYIDLGNAALAPSFPGTLAIADGLLRKVRAGQHEPKVVRVVLDIESIERHKIFALSDPFRVVIDVTGESEKHIRAPEETGTARLTLAQQLGLGVKRVVIDPGHGGKDPGAVGYRGIREKVVTLAIAKRLQEKLEKELKLEAILTRSSDKYLPLEERTALANTQKADLFVSIHTNAHKSQRVYGVSTYILNVAMDAEAARVAALENAVTAKRISDLEKILNDLMLNSKVNESSRLAHEVQRGLVQGLRRDWDKIEDLGVKQAPFYVLIGAQMPCIMVETSFISNPREANRLVSAQYQEAIARGIVAGIRSYINQIESVPGRG